MDYRNIAIIAHVDHGKTTLIDAMLAQTHTFSKREPVEERVLDSNELEKERGITIYAKNAAIQLGDTKVNIIDTPGHADFGSEVERVLRMVDSVLLLVDAYEGPMPQTKFVLRKSLELGLKPIVVINKIDKPTARPDEVLTMVFDLFIELGASEEQLDFQHIFTNAKAGIAKVTPEQDSKDLKPLLELILNTVPPAESAVDAPMLFQPVNLSYDDYVGRMATGRIYTGTLRAGMDVTVIDANGARRTKRISHVFTSNGLNKQEVQEAYAGDIATIAGIPEIMVGETLAEDGDAEPLPSIKIDPPTLMMNFLVNNSPFAGKEGTLVTSRQIRDRLAKELETNVGLKIAFPDAADVFNVSGRGEMHLAILIETMRREGYELQVSQPRVIIKETNGKKEEPYETVIIDVPEAYAGTVIELLGKRGGEMTNMQSKNGSTRIEYVIPTRGLLGFQMEFTTATHGEGMLSHVFLKYGPYSGEINRRSTESMICGVPGKTTAFSLNNLQQRGVLFIGPGVDVYEGMVIGTSSKESMVVNPTKGKHLTNTRAAGSDDAIVLIPPQEMTLERALEYIAEDEYAEITPTSIRIRKRLLTENERKKAHSASR